MITALVDLLATFYQAGNLQQVEAITRSMLATIPNDLVALQFLGLALYRTGRHDEAYRAFGKAAARLERTPPMAYATSCEQAASATYRKAVRVDSGLAEGWQQIADVLARLGFQKAASRAREAARTASATNRTRFPLGAG